MALGEQGAVTSTSSGRRASATAGDGGGATAPPSPRPLMPSGLSGENLQVHHLTIGMSLAEGMA
jgi:hypothetical protein